MLFRRYASKVLRISLSNNAQFKLAAGKRWLHSRALLYAARATVHSRRRYLYNRYHKREGRDSLSDIRRQFRSMNMDRPFRARTPAKVRRLGEYGSRAKVSVLPNFLSLLLRLCYVIRNKMKI